MFTFPVDSNNKAGAVRATQDNNDFYVPVVVFNADGVTPTSKMQHFGNSTDNKPTAAVPIGATYLEIDTKIVYIYDGTEWVVF